MCILVCIELQRIYYCLENEMDFSRKQVYYQKGEKSNEHEIRMHERDFDILTFIVKWGPMSRVHISILPACDTKKI